VSDLDTTPADTQGVVEKPAQVVGEATPTQPLVVITEQQVALSTAAALSVPAVKRRRGLIAAVQAMFVRTSADPEQQLCPPPFYPPRRDEFVEDAAMRREMFRL
jgi:hypothetical protein